MKKIVIIGAGGFGREVAWLIERINGNLPIYEILGFIDDETPKGTKLGNYQVVGNISSLKEYDSDLCVCVAIGNANIRRKVVSKIKLIKDFCFPNLIDPTAIVRKDLLGEGNIICANNVFTVDYLLKDFIIINLMCTMGHDVKIESYVTVYPGVNISGNVYVNELSEIGTGTKIIQGKSIGKNSIIGAGSMVNKDITDNVTAVGSPAKVIKYH